MACNAAEFSMVPIFPEDVVGNASSGPSSFRALRERRLPAGRCVASVTLIVIVYATLEPTNDVRSACC